MTDGPDPERLLAEALRAQAVSTPLPPPSPLSIDEPPAAVHEPAEDNPPKDNPPEGKPATDKPTDEAPQAEDAGESPAAEGSPREGSAGEGEGGAGEGGDARLVELLSGAGHGLLSGRDPGTVNLPYIGVPADRTGPVSTTRLNPGRPQLAWWWMLLLAIVLGLAAGAVAGVLTLV